MADVDEREWTIRGETGFRGMRRGMRVDGPWTDEPVAVVSSTKHQGAVEALQQIYNWCHMSGDGMAGEISDKALRALGIDPDLSRGQ